MEKASARRTAEGIVVTFPRDLESRLAELAALIPLERRGAGTFRVAATHSALELLTRVFGETLDLDRSLHRAMIEVQKRRIIRRQIVGPRSATGTGPFVASPARSVFHRTNCEWAGEIGAEMLLIPNIQTAQ